jgi:hypothetical protein
MEVLMTDKTLALVYEEPPEQVFINAASAFGITMDQARRAYGQMICDSQPTIVGDAEPEVLALNSRAIKTMLALEGRPQQGSAIDTRWFGIRHEQPERGPRNGGFLRDRRY